jgi:hypothetical protein
MRKLRGMEGVQYGGCKDGYGGGADGCGVAVGGTDGYDMGVLRGCVQTRGVRREYKERGAGGYK